MLTLPEWFSVSSLILEDMALPSLAATKSMNMYGPVSDMMLFYKTMSAADAVLVRRHPAFQRLMAGASIKHTTPAY